MSVEWHPLLEDPAFALNGNLIREYGLLDIWGARDSGDPEKVEALRKRWERESREYHGWILQAWYKQRRANTRDPHQSPLVVQKDQNGLHGIIADYPHIEKYYSSGGFKAIFQTSGMTPSEIEVMEMRIKGVGPREIARLRGTTVGTTANLISRAKERLVVRFRIYNEGITPEENVDVA